jgi:hypothetical protein
MLNAISRSRLFCLLPFGAFSDRPKIDEVSHERPALTLFHPDPPDRFQAGRSMLRVTRIVLIRSDGNHRFHDLRRSRRRLSAGRTFLRCTARADMAASVAGMLATRPGRPKGGAANQHVFLLPHNKEPYGGKDRTVEMSHLRTHALEHYTAKARPPRGDLCTRDRRKRRCRASREALNNLVRLVEPNRALSDRPFICFQASIARVL